MADIQTYAPPSRTVYYQVLDAATRHFNTATRAFEAYTAASYAAYSVPLVEQGTGTGVYAGNAPTGLPAGTYTVQVYTQTGATPAPVDPLTNTGTWVWGGVSYTPAAFAGIPATIRAAFQVQLAGGAAAQPVPVGTTGTLGTLGAGAFGWPIPVATPQLYPEDAGVGISLLLLDGPTNPATPVTIGATASLVNPAVSLTPQPLAGFLLGAPLYDAVNRVAYFVVGNGTLPPDSEVLLDINIGIGGATPSGPDVRLSIPVRGSE